MAFLDSDVKIINLALTAMGERTITDRSEDTEPAVVMNLIYEQVRDNELQKHPWAFAMARSTLAEDSSSPSFEWTNQYVLPADCLRPWRLYNTVVGPNYVVEGKLLLTDEETVYLRYIKRVETTTDFDVMFVTCLYLQLAIVAVQRLTSNRSKLSDLVTLYNQALLDAQVSNAILDLDRDEPQNEEENYSWVKR
jgi:hypothetical protein